jgi:hypothetical protein
MQESIGHDQLGTLREQLVEALQGGSAHLDIASVFGPVRDGDWGKRVGNAPHTLWQLLDHTRFTVRDLYVFSTDEAYVAPEFPRDYWPGSEAPESLRAAKQSLAGLEDAVESMVALVENPSTDLFAPIPWGDGQTILHEALLAASHTSYHLGQAMFLRKQLEK